MRRIKKDRGRSGARRVRARRADPLPDPVRDHPVRDRVHEHVALTDAVRAGARKAAVSRTAADPTRRRKTPCSARRPISTRRSFQLNHREASDWVSGDTVTVDATYPYSINLLGIVVASGNLHSSTTERVE